MTDYKQLKYLIAHDPCRAGDRAPLGAVTMGSTVRLVLRVGENVRSEIEAVDIVVREGGDSFVQAANPCAIGYESSISLASKPHVSFYLFELMMSNGETLVYAPGKNGKATSGELYEDASYEGSGFQISVFDPGFETPDWLSGSIMYQIFPDRFARGRGGILEEGVEYHEGMGRPVHLQKDWGELPPWAEGETYDPLSFYGGTLSGIREKLGYLDSLGVEILYLNPVFEARSNHRYDTADYEHIDPLLGDDEELGRLCSEAAEHGISIVLDAVLSHTGADSKYFDDAVGNPHSPYGSWYEFYDSEEGEEPSGQGNETLPGNSGKSYRCWWGDPTLPEVDERNEGWQRYLFGEVLPKWLSAGVRGYRLDVADEIPDDVLEKLRTTVKESRTDAGIIGEVWEDATTKASYGEPRTYALGRSLDSVMNYPLREALLGFATGAVDAFQLATFIKLQHSNYPAPLYRSLMNLLSSHDVERVRTYLALGGPLRQADRAEQCEAVRAITSQQDAQAAKLQAMIAGIVYALPGMPCIYYGDEKGMHGGGDPFCRAPMAWDALSRTDVGEDLTDRYRKLGELRKGSRSLRDGAIACIASDADVICIVRKCLDDDALAIAIANRAAEPKTVAIDIRALSDYAGFDFGRGVYDGDIATFEVQSCACSFVFA